MHPRVQEDQVRREETEETGPNEEGDTERWIGLCLLFLLRVANHRAAFGARADPPSHPRSRWYTRAAR